MFMTIGTLVDWLDADLGYGSGRNEAIFFAESWRCVVQRWPAN